MKEKKSGSKLSRVLKGKATYKNVIKKSPQVTIVENQPVTLKDKSRFFKEEWDEEKRSLFFK